MSTATQVRRLAVHTPDRETGDALRPRLEDALRVASLPGAGEGRLVFIRRLRLQGVRRDTGAQSLAAAIERAARLDGGRLVHGEAAAAAAADAVWFADRAEAGAALFVRLVRGEPADAWYWPLVFPELRLHAAGECVRLLVSAALRPAAAGRGWALRAASAFALEVARRGAVAKLAAALQAPEAQTVLGDYGWTATGIPGGGEPAMAPFDADAVAELAGVADGEDSRSGPVLVLCLLACAGNPALAESNSLPGLARRALDAVTAAQAGSPVPAAGDVEPDGRHDWPVAIDSHRSTKTPTPALPSLPLPAADTLQGAWHGTQAAGLLFLLPILARLGVSLHGPIARAAVADEGGEERGSGSSDVSLAVDVPSLLSRCLKWLRVPENDAAWRLVGVAESGAVPTDGADAPLFWLRRMRAWSAGELRMPLRRLLLRRGHVSVSMTHADVELPLASSDIRIRRAGLDLDPGWVAAYGRVVRFHYR